MPRKNQIPYVSSQTLTGGRVAWYWKPSPKLRRIGYKTVLLGEDEDEAYTKAITINRELAEAMAGRRTSAPPPLASLTWRQAVFAYKEHPSWLNLKPKSRAEYGSRLKTLEKWACDMDGNPGELRLGDLDRDMVLTLRDTLVESTTSSKHRTAALLRVLGLFMQFCEDRRYIKANPASKLKIPQPKSRARRVLVDELRYVFESARALEMPHIEIGVLLGFYTMQREGDLLATTEFRLKALGDISNEARRVLAGTDRRVLGIELMQEKTQEWVAIALVPQARKAIEAMIASQRERNVAGTHLIPHPEGGRACPDWRFQRDFRAVMNHAVAQMHALRRRDLAARLTGIQYRDMRRSGMCWMRDLGVPVPLIAAISGHSIEQTQKILDVYMPRDTRAAADGMAMALTRQAERDAADREQEG